MCFYEHEKSAMIVNAIMALMLSARVGIVAGIGRTNVN